MPELLCKSAKQVEIKEEEIWIPYENFPQQVRAAIAVFETDGWQGRDEEARNPYRWTTRLPPEGLEGEGKWTRITFTRIS